MSTRTSRERALERAQHVVAGRQVAAARRDLGAQEVAERGDVAGRPARGRCAQPGVDEPGVGELGQRRATAQARSAPAEPSSVTVPCHDQGKSIHRSVSRHE